MLGLARQRSSLPPLRQKSAPIGFRELLADGFRYAIELLAPLSLPKSRRGRPKRSHRYSPHDLILAQAFVLDHRVCGTWPTKVALRRWVRASERQGRIPSQQRGVNFDRIRPLVADFWLDTEPWLIQLRQALERSVLELLDRQELAAALLDDRAIISSDAAFIRRLLTHTDE